MWLIYFRPNIETIPPLKERGIRLSSKLFQFPFQIAFCTDLNSQSFISVKRPSGFLFLCEPTENFKISFFLSLWVEKKNMCFYHTGIEGNEYWDTALKKVDFLESGSPVQQITL